MAAPIRALRAIPMARLLAVGELLLLARDHIARLQPQERKRLVALLRQARGRPHNLSARERRELSALIRKAEPRLFMGSAVQKLTGVPMPGKGRKHN